MNGHVSAEIKLVTVFFFTPDKYKEMIMKKQLQNSFPVATV